MTTTECKCGGAIVGLCNCRPGQPGIQSSKPNTERVGLTPEMRRDAAAEADLKPHCDGQGEVARKFGLICWKRGADWTRADMIAHPEDWAQKSKCPRCSDMFYHPKTMIEDMKQHAAEWEEIAKTAEAELQSLREENKRLRELLGLADRAVYRAHRPDESERLEMYEEHWKEIDAILEGK